MSGRRNKPERAVNQGFIKGFSRKECPEWRAVSGFSVPKKHAEKANDVSDLRQSRRLDGGGAAQSRRALRASADTLISIPGFKPRLSRPARHERGESRREGLRKKIQRLLTPALSSTSRRRGSIASLLPCQSRQTHTFPEMSNFRSPPAQPEDFLWIKFAD
jgi:hypothetical protein